jgi:hypothetical protein
MLKLFYEKKTWRKKESAAMLLSLKKMKLGLEREE